MDRTFEEWDRKAAEAIDETEAGIKDLWGRARATAKGGPPPDPNETVTLEARPEAVKVLYARVLAAQCLVDGRLDPREIQYLYVFMSRIGLGPDSREEVRRSLGSGEVGSEEVVRLVERVASEVPGNEEEIAVSVVKDLAQVSRADGRSPSRWSRPTSGYGCGRSGAATKSWTTAWGTTWASSAVSRRSSTPWRGSPTRSGRPCSR